MKRLSQFFCYILGLLLPFILIGFSVNHDQLWYWVGVIAHATFSAVFFYLSRHPQAETITMHIADSRPVNAFVWGLASFFLLSAFALLVLPIWIYLAYR